MLMNLMLAFCVPFTLVAAFAMIVTPNLMHACVYLLATLLGIAGLYASMGAEFIAVTQVMVYVGGIVILMLFAIMLTGGKDFKSKAQELFSLVPNMGNTQTKVTASIAAIIMMILSYLFYKKLKNSIVIAPDDFAISTLDGIGKLLVTDYILVFELSSVLLLGALIGAAIIARPNKEKH